MHSALRSAPPRLLQQLVVPSEPHQLLALRRRQRARRALAGVDRRSLDSGGDSVRAWVRLVDSGVTRAAFAPVMGGAIAGRDRVDVLIVTAIKLEYGAVLAVHTGALAGSEWEERPGPTKLKVAFRTSPSSSPASPSTRKSRREATPRVGKKQAILPEGDPEGRFQARCLTLHPR
jgi:hypothetical protein